MGDLRSPTGRVKDKISAEIYGVSPKSILLVLKKMKNVFFYKLLIIGMLVVSFSSASAVTKPGPDANIDNLSYVFYLYYDNGQLFADRDFEVKFDILNETYSPESVDGATAYRGEILNFKSEAVKTFTFDPKKGDPNLTTGKVAIKGPYVPNALSARFYDEKNQQLVTMFVSIASICNDDDFCDSVAGENEKTCVNDCKKPRATPVTTIPEQSSGFLGDFDLNTILIYVVGGVGVIVVAWLGWKWWKKKRGESFLPPPSPSGGSTIPRPPMPPPPLSGGGLPPL